MTSRATIFGTGAPGGAVEYRGDLPAPNQTYAGVLDNTPLISRLRQVASTAWTRSAIVNRAPRRGGIRSFYVHGGVVMPNGLPNPGPESGNVNISAFQRVLVQLMDWQINPSWFEAGYPRNLGFSTRVSQLETNQTGGPGKSSSDQRPLFTKVQTVPRARAVTPRFGTRSARG